MPVFKLTVIPFLYEPKIPTPRFIGLRRGGWRRKKQNVQPPPLDLRPPCRSTDFVVTAYEAVENASNGGRLRDPSQSETDAIRQVGSEPADTSRDR